MPRPEIAELIERLSKATEGSRELDEAIAKAVGVIPPEAVFSHYAELGGPYYNWTDPGDGRPYRRGSYGAEYTTSVDAALTLLPKPYCWQVKRAIGCQAIVWLVCGDYTEGGRAVLTGEHTHNPAIALTIAALIAIQAERALSQPDSQ